MMQNILLGRDEGDVKDGIMGGYLSTSTTDCRSLVRERIDNQHVAQMARGCPARQQLNMNFTSK
jgi:hypothetical protein